MYRHRSFISLRIVFIISDTPTVYKMIKCAFK